MARAALAIRLTLLIGATGAFAPVASAGQAATADSAAPEKAALPAGAPTFEQIISVKRVGAPAISTDGKRVAYTVNEANWDENSFETEIWVADANGRTPARQLTDAKKSSNAPVWSPDSQQVAFGSDRDGKRQLYVINLRGGEARALTTSKEGVTAFKWSPDGQRIAYTEPDARTDAREARDKQYGDFDIVDEDVRRAQLHVIDVATKATRRLTSGVFSVQSFDWSPEGKSIAFEHRFSEDVATMGTADISIVAVEDAKVRTLVSSDGPDGSPVWSPDGTTIAFETAMGDPAFFYVNGRIATVPAAGGAPTSITPSLDEDANLIAWTRSGIYVSALAKTAGYLYRVDPASKAVTRLGAEDGTFGAAFSVSADGAMTAFLRADARSIGEVMAAATSSMQAVRLSDANAQLSGWALGSRELVSWKSQDGAVIEGVLHKPPGFTAGRRYPLLVVIHGGPTGTSRPVPLSGYVYPIVQWLGKGALVLEPNYRGSGGYGGAFRALNVRNLGVGDAWDVVSGVDHLVAEGLVDRDRVGAMGWSQGGYISAFLTTHDAVRFKAISVGAGISDWMTYYVNTDIHPFTRQYLKATPWDDPEIYAKTSPITYIKQAKTPTLIQHGENDQRVPLPNAFELYQGLQDMRVPVRIVVYKGFGHGLNKPRAQLAAQQHNWDWFEQHFWQTSAPTSAGAGR